MADLTTTQKAMLLDGADAPLFIGAYSVVSSDPLIVGVVQIQDANGLAGNGAGSADVTVTRNADGATVTNTIVVEGSAPFTWHLAAPVPK